MPRSSVDPVEHFARDVVEGRFLAGGLVRLACERHLRDLVDGAARGLVWDADAAQHAIDFFATVLRLNGGVYEGMPFVPQCWQEFIIGSLFGWKRLDRSRRFRTAYVEMGKGTGKTPTAAGIGQYCLVADAVPRAEVYAVATRREQAMILFRDAVAMVHQSPALKKRLHLSGAPGNEWNIAYHETHSFFRPVANDDKKQSGFRVHCALADEVHEHPTPVMIDMMKANMKGANPLLVEITNSGFNRETICWNHHNYSVKVLEGFIADDWFAYVCQLDPCAKCRSEGLWQPKDGCKNCDDWRNEKVWPKTNPNMLAPETADKQTNYVKRQVAEAIGMPSMENVVKRLDFCIWTDTVTAAIPMAEWDLCDDDSRSIEGYVGQECYAGLDLASTTDIAAFVLAFKEADGGVTVFPFFWVPENKASERSHRDRVDYVRWAQQGFIRTTPGNSIDYDRIRADINELCKKFWVKEIAVDRWNATQIVTQLMGDGNAMFYFGQGYKDMTAPTKEILRLVAERKLYHAANPVLRWMASNLAVETDAAGNLKPTKALSTEKIDGIVALVMALGRSMVDTGDSIYESRGFAGDDE